MKVALLLRKKDPEASCAATGLLCQFQHRGFFVEQKTHRQLLRQLPGTCWLSSFCQQAGDHGAFADGPGGGVFQPCQLAAQQVLVLQVAEDHGFEQALMCLSSGIRRGSSVLPFQTVQNDFQRLTVENIEVVGAVGVVELAGRLLGQGASGAA